MKYIWILATLLSLAACGPEQTSASKDAQQYAQQFQDRLTQVKPAFGTYLGKMTKSTGETVDIMLYISQNVIPISNPGRVEQTTVPTAQGSLKICTSDSCIKGNTFNDIDSDLIQFTGADLKGQNLYLYAAGIGNCTNAGCNGAGSAYSSQYSFSGTLINGTITGTVSASNNDFGTLTATRR